MATKRRRSGLSQTEQALLLQEFERYAERTDQRSDPKRRRELLQKSKLRSKTKRKAKKIPKAKRTRAKAIGSKFRYKFKTQEISHDFEPPLRIRHNSDKFKVANKIFDRFEKTVRFKKGKPRIFSFFLNFKPKYKRAVRNFSTLAQECESKADIYNLIVYAVETLKASLVTYQLRNQWVRISRAMLKEYNELPGQTV